MAALAVVPSPAVTAAPLYVIEDHLAALIETAELVSPEQELEFRMEFQTALTAAVEKRDRVGQFLAHLEQQIDFAKFEIDRLRQRKATCERAIARLEDYVIVTIESLGTDSKGKYRTLEGKTTTFSLRACPSSVEVTDESAIPPEYTTLTLKLPAAMWEQLLDGLDIEQRSTVLRQMKSPEVSVDKRSVKARRRHPRGQFGHRTTCVEEEVRVKPVRNPGYLRWIRTLPCSVCRTTRGVEAAHTGPHGLSQKSSDWSAIPLCARHHRTGTDSYHQLGPRKFSGAHQINIPAIVARLNAKPRIRVESGGFVGRFDDQEYALGSMEAGLARAIRRMSELRREIQAEVV